MYKFLFVIAFLSYGCATSPTGRKQFIALPENQMASMGSQAFEDQKKKQPIESDLRTNNYVRCVVNPLLQVAGTVDGVKNWEIVVFRDNNVNAFALPGGHIGVYTGMFKAAQTADQLAAVIGHEIGHVISKHSNERVSEAFLISGGLQILDAATKKGNKNHSLLMAALGVGAQYGIILPHSRTQESEADIIGLDLMAHAGFDPRESILLWQNMSKFAGGSPPEFMSTHPSHGTRINDLNKKMSSALEKYEVRKSQGALPQCKL